MSVVLFIVNGAVLALGAHAFGWAALLFAAAAYFGVSTGVVGLPLRPSTAPEPPAENAERYRLAHPGTRLGGAVDALRRS